MNDFTKGWHPDMSLEDTKNLAYWERNMLALLLANSHGECLITGKSGWYYHGKYEGWTRVISIGNGSITFHVPDDFDMGTLSQIEPNWDGHTTEDKWKTVKVLCEIDK